jgi:hypothetical protein
MAIFSRRVIQRMINENATILTKLQLDKHIDELNRADESSLAYEWEVVLINAFSKLGRVVHEPDFGGECKCDLYFTLNIDPSQSFLADIRTISDKGYEQENPREAFSKELLRIIRKYRLNPNHFFYEIGGEIEGPFRKRKMKLKLPFVANFKDIFNDNFKKFMERIVKKHSSPDSFVVRTEKVKLSIMYNPMQQYAGATYPSYTAAYSLENNPVYNSLKIKTAQIKRTGYSGPLSIFLCDGGCHLLNAKGYAGLDYGVDDIIQRFLGQNSSISFVLTFLVDRSENYLHPMGVPQMQIRLYKNFPAFERVSGELLDCINKLNYFLPEPVNDAANAINRLKSVRRKEGLSKYGGMEMSEKTVRISARALLELLSGKVEQKKFLKDHRLIPTETHPDTKNIFEIRLNHGSLIDEIQIEKSEIEDDDWILIKFTDPDPAVSPFRSYP